MKTMNPPDPLAERRRSGPQHAGTIRAYFPWWDTQVRPGLVRLVEAFPERDLDFKPRAELMTAREMIVHLAECECDWIHVTIDDGRPEDLGLPPDEDPGRRSAVEALDRASLLALLERWHRPTQAWLDRPESELAHEVVSEPRGGRRYTVHWILDRGHEHEIHHRAQLAVYLRMLGTEPPSMW